MAGIKEYNAWCAAPKTRTREITKQTKLILMPPRQISLVRVELGECVDCGGSSTAAGRMAGIMLWKHGMAGVSLLADISPG